MNTIKYEEELYGVFSETIEQEKMLENVKKAVFLFSGGKDATLGLYYMNQYIKEHSLDIELNPIMVTFPKHVYFNPDGSELECFTTVKKFWKEQGVDLKILTPEADDFGEDLTGACKLCKSARKSVVDEYLNSCEDGTAVITGYTLYDALAYMDEICLVSDFDKDNLENADDKTKKRVLNCLHKMKMREELPNGLIVIRPLIKMKENMIMDVVKEKELPYITTPCRASVAKHKREYFAVLNVAAPIMNATYEGLMSFLDVLGIDLPDTFEDVESSNYFTDC